VDVKRPKWVAFGAAAERPANPIRRRRPVYLRLGDAWVQVRTFAAEGENAFVGNVESLSEAPPAGAGVKPGDWVRFEPRHVFSACISHE